MTRLLLLASLGLLTLLGPARAQIGGVGRVSVRLPRDARLYVDDVFCPLPGPLRTFDTPPLDQGRKYYYTLTVEINADGKPVRVSRRVTVEAGKPTETDFGDRAAILAVAALKEESAIEKQPDRVPVRPPEGSADATPGLPDRPPPTQVLAALKDGTISMVVPEFVWEEKKVSYETVKDGVKTTAIKTVKVAVPKLATRQVSLRDAKVIDNRGKVVAGETLARVLDRERVVLLTEQDKVDPFYLSTLKEGTLIVLVPPGASKPDVTVVPMPPAQPPASADGRPQGEPPLLVQAVLDGNDIVFERVIQQTRPVSVTEDVIDEDGNKKQVVKTKNVIEQKVIKVKVAGDKAQLSTAGGKKLTAGDLKRYLTDKPAAVIISSDSLPVDPFHLQLYDPETLVVVPPPMYSAAPARPRDDSTTPV